MKAHRPAALATTILILAACNPFAKKPVEISSGEVAYSSRWNATLATPPDLAGAMLGAILLMLWKLAQRAGGAGTSAA